MENLNDTIVEVVRLGEEVGNLKENFNKMEKTIKEEMKDIKNNTDKSIEQNRKNYNKLMIAILGLGGTFTTGALLFILEMIANGGGK